VNAIQIQGDDLVWGQVPGEDPAPGPGEVAITVRATAVNRADLLQRIGAYPPPPGASEILGLECSGTVTALGRGVSDLDIGDSVCALLSGGGYAEIVVCPAEQVLEVPPHLDLARAAALPEALATAWMALRDAGRLIDGERVLIHAGASGIGTAMIQVCRAWGNPCFVTASAPKVPRCVALGAEGGGVRGGWEEAVRAWGEPDVIVDPIGRGTLAGNQRVLAAGGRMVLLGLLGGRSDEIDLARVLLRHQTLLGTTLRSRSQREKARIVAGVSREIWPHVFSGRIDPVIDCVLPIERAAEAHERLRADATVGKVVLTVGR
jgi:putative PIG3 family NAD(P)H quinone oxidoreductase